ncbi:MAG: adenylosuccinate synthetase [Bacteroidota bacterium]
MIVVGLGFGDEGKGLTTSFLCSQVENPLVVRFNGGHQAGHTVVFEGKRHVFSSFGSGSLQGVPTYWSAYCTFYPSSFLVEYRLLDKPVIYVNPLCPVTTPFDVDYNQLTESAKKHGSVGVGFGATIQRQEQYYKLFVQDLFFEPVLVAKLKNIAAWYGAVDIDEQINFFLESVKQVKGIIQIADDSILQQYNPIFEGAQGILLDMDFGFFPNVTRSNSTTKNALQMYPAKEVYYVTRSYLTRHGNGFLPNEKKLELVNNEKETNKTHEYQGAFRTAELDISLLNYALGCDHHFSKGLRKNLVITCMDQYPIDVAALLDNLDTAFDKVYISNGDSLSNVSLFR